MRHDMQKSPFGPSRLPTPSQIKSPHLAGLLLSLKGYWGAYIRPAPGRLIAETPMRGDRKTIQYILTLVLPHPKPPSGGPLRGAEGPPWTGQWTTTITPAKRRLFELALPRPTPPFRIGFQWVSCFSISWTFMVRPLRYRGVRLVVLPSVPAVC